ncbi:hypothetical protein ATK86_6965 [Nocardia fluminea]|uniref:Uncharacterized protein n=1 Tax=Nocardia fluminea TaxID=134984 RepID=A0A2N3VLH3_9NOCA|nr:hypothetical protein ATK86_6965 [Nocardia fluminea]
MVLRACLPDRDPIPPCRTEFGVPNSLQNTTTTLDRPHRPEILGRAHNQHPLHPAPARLTDHLPQRPSSQPATACGRPDPVPDVPHLPYEFPVPVPQRDPAEYPTILDYPSIRATPVPTLCRRGDKARNPELEPFYRLDVITRQQPETVLVRTGPPLGMRVEPCSVQIDRGCDQSGTRTDRTSRRSGYSFNLAALDPPKAAADLMIQFGRSSVSNRWTQTSSGPRVPNRSSKSRQCEAPCVVGCEQFGSVSLARADGADDQVGQRRDRFLGGRGVQVQFRGQGFGRAEHADAAQAQCCGGE